MKNVFASLLLLMSPLLFGQNTLSFSFGQRTLSINTNNVIQTMDGFGASDAWRCNNIGKNWPIDKRNQIADLLFSKELDASGNPKGIGLSIWRFNLGAGSSEQGAASNISDEWRRSECFTSDGVTYDMNKQAGQVWFMKAARARGVEKLLAFANSAPVYLTNNGKAYATSSEFYNLKSGKMPNLADFWVNSIDKLKTTHGLTIDYISPFNEPQYEWDGRTQEGSPATNFNIYSFVKDHLSPKMIVKGFSSQIVVGESVNYESLYKTVTGKTSRTNQINYFFAPNSSQNIAGLSNVKKSISGHSYWQVWPLESLISSRQEAATKVQSVPGLSLWSSEYSILESPGTTELPGGSGNGRDLGMQTALWAARIISTDISVGGASSWQWWTAISRADYKDGLVYVDDGTNNGSVSNANYCKNDGFVRESKILWALGNFSFFVRPGMQRIGVPVQDELGALKDVMLTVYKDVVNNKLIIVAVNYGELDQRYKFDITQGSLINNEVIPYITSANSNLKRADKQKINNIGIPAKSVVTFVGELQ